MALILHPKRNVRPTFLVSLVISVVQKLAYYKALSHDVTFVLTMPVFSVVIVNPESCGRHVVGMESRFLLDPLPS